MLIWRSVKHLFGRRRSGAGLADALERASRLFSVGDFAATAALCAELTAQYPHAIEAWHLHALACLKLGDTQTAISSLKHALALAPAQAELHLSFAAVYQQAGDPQRAVASCREALTQQPGLLPARVMLAQLLDRQKDLAGAAENFEAAVRIDPGLREARERLFAIYHEQGRDVLASAQVDAMIGRWGDDGLHIRSALLIPGFYDTVEEIDAVRHELASRVEQLLANKRLQLADPVREIGVSPFYLAYHGRNDRRLMTAIARLVRQSYSAIAIEMDQRPPPSRIKVGFVSRHFANHSIGRLNKGLIAGLARERFEVTVYALDSHDDEIARGIRNCADHYFDCGRSSLREVAELIAAHRPHILDFADIGMEPKSYFLAFSRLAPVQCVTWGHPDTTGIDTIDYFISAAGIEVPDADQHYSERLVRLRSFFLPDYDKPSLPPDLKSRERLGLPTDRSIYFCPQSLFKLHPEFDAAVGEILRADGRGEIWLMEGGHRHWTERVRGRFAQTVPDVAARIRFLPRVPWHELLNLMAVVDVVLDTFHFGGGNTTYEALAMGVPVVTLPAEFVRGRFTLGCYRQMGLQECVADSPQAYVTIANRLAQDRGYREHVRRSIIAKNDALFHNVTAVRETEEFFERALAAAPGRVPDTIVRELDRESKTTGAAQ
jgi:protein O-GlcNAc transferase